MRAIIYRAWGPPESLELADGLAEPQAKAEEVTIAVKAAGVNPGDAATLSGKFRWMAQKGFPKILGLEVAGEVIAAPSGAGFSLGERVFAATDILLAGGYAERICLPASSLARIPQGLSFEQAAAVPLAGLTAFQSLVDIARLASGERLLVHGASGGVGSLAVQIARDLGAHVVAVASQQHAEWLREFGSHELVDYRTTPLALLTPRFDVVFDVHGGIGAEVRRHILTPKGRYVSIVPSWTGFARQALDRIWPGPSVRYLFVKPSGAELQQLAEKIAAGALRSTLTRSFDFSEAAAAVRLVASGHTRGKLVLTWS